MSLGRPSFSRSLVCRRAARTGFRAGPVIMVPRHLHPSSASGGSSGECAGRAHSADEARITFVNDQTTAMYLFPEYSLTSTLTGPFQLLSESPNFLWRLE